ncbi:hypothetical protein [Staphylococcus saprophyticus]|uniref:hypothetical protein n=1 Tax=Staphylococcus TaxID=1279 RepID=UPI00157DA498|nr:hypothetical protein [Staphylococcus saprophyticus]MDW4149033.1 hypothetical protein [Staphylococcus saprophyticus]QKQ32241.1 hypothetical protein HSZ50_09295 [Staphylococcus saprophyticus]
MKHILAWLTAVLSTALFAMVTSDFHYSIVFSVLSFIGSYAFWNSYYAQKKDR